MLTGAATSLRSTRSIAGVVAAALAVGLSLAVGLAVGDPSPGGLLLVGGGLVLALVGTVLVRPFAGFLVLAFSVFFLMVVPVAGTGRSANLFDIVLIPLVVVSVFGGVRAVARARDALESGPRDDALRSASRRFAHGAALYFGVAALSLLPMALRLGVGPAFTSGLSLARAVQGALLFPLGLLWLRDEKRIDATFRVAFAAGVLFALVNSVGVFGLGVERAGVTWMVSDLAEPIADPNDGATALLVLWALLHARQGARPSRVHPLLMTLVLLMLLLTQSRSGLLAFVTFTLLTVRRVRWRWLAGGVLVILLALPLVPADYWERLGRSLTFQRGSFEVFSFLVRVYGYRTAWHVFLDHPLIGVGYLGFRFVSERYNELRFVIGTAENFLLETLVGLGVVGFAVLGVAFARLFALGRAVRRSVPPGTIAGELGRLHTPLILSLLVANMTGDNFVGMVGVGQVALWCALLVRAGHLAVPRAAEA